MKTLYILCFLIVFLNLVIGIVNCINRDGSARDPLGWFCALIWIIIAFLNQF